MDDVAAVSEASGTLVVVEELVDHDSSSGAKRAAGCATLSCRGINVEPDVVVVLVVVLLARRLPSCLSRSAKTPASFTEPVTTTRYNGVGLTDVLVLKGNYRDFVSFSQETLLYLKPRTYFYRIFTVISVTKACRF